MSAKIEHKVEKLDDCTSRYRVYGGWIVRTIWNGRSILIAETFVPDPNNKWKVIEPVVPDVEMDYTSDPLPA